MNNFMKLAKGLTGLSCHRDIASLSEETLRMIACPFEAAEDPDALEIDGCPSELQCARCKRIWLNKEAIDE